ncbi:3146_t:CDS:2, partial [Ambispora leptoticha]
TKSRRYLTSTRSIDMTSFSITSKLSIDEDSDTEDEEVSDHEVQVSGEEISAGRTSTDPIISWTLSTGKNPGLSRNFRSSGEDVEVKNLFTDDEWDEMIEDFGDNVNLSDLEVERKKPLYELMDKIEAKFKLETKPSDLITEIESCVIEVRISLVLISYGSTGSNDHHL